MEEKAALELIDSLADKVVVNPKSIQVLAYAEDLTKKGYARLGDLAFKTVETLAIWRAANTGMLAVEDDAKFVAEARELVGIQTATQELMVDEISHALNDITQIAEAGIAAAFVATGELSEEALKELVVTVGIRPFGEALGNAFVRNNITTLDIAAAQAQGVTESANPSSGTGFYL